MIYDIETECMRQAVRMGLDKLHARAGEYCTMERYCMHGIGRLYKMRSRERKSACISVAFSRMIQAKIRKRKRKKNKKNKKMRKRKTKRKTKNPHLEIHHLIALKQKSPQISNKQLHPFPHTFIHRLRTRVAAMIRQF